MVGYSKPMKKAAKKVLGTLFSRTLWLARGTSMVMGLAVMLALVVGVASTALAGTGVGAVFNLGQTNTVGAISKLVGSVAGPSLQIDNNSTDSAATALDLQVESGKAPMKVNSGTKVANLNADKLDGQDSKAFAPMPIYASVLSDGSFFPLFSSQHSVSASRVSTGTYLVNFDQDVTGCAHIAQPVQASGASTKTVHGVRFGGGEKQVKVEHYNSAGSLVDGDFQLAIFCDRAKFPA